MPELDDVLAAHVAWLRLLRRSERTIYERQRAVIRLAAWLGAKVTASDDGTHGLDSAGIVREHEALRGGGLPRAPPPGPAAGRGGPAPAAPRPPPPPPPTPLRYPGGRPPAPPSRVE